MHLKKEDFSRATDHRLLIWSLESKRLVSNIYFCDSANVITPPHVGLVKSGVKITSFFLIVLLEPTKQRLSAVNKNAKEFLLCHSYYRPDPV